MRRYHIVCRILLILPIIDFVVAAPVPLQEKPQALDALAGVYVVHIPEDAITMLEKRVDESELEMTFNIFDDRPAHSSRPSGSSATSTEVSSVNPFSTPRPNIARPPGEPPAAPPSVSSNNLFSAFRPYSARPPGESPATPPSVPSVNLFTPRPPGESSATHPSSSSQLSWPTNWWIDPKRPVLYIPEEPSPVSSPDHSPMFKLFGYTESHGVAEPGESSAARPASSSLPSEPADERIGLNQPLPPLPEEPSPVFSPDHSPPSSHDEMNELMFKLFGDTESHDVTAPGESSAARPSSSSQLPWPTSNWWTDLKQPLPSIPEEPSPVSSPDHAPPSSHDGMNELMFKLFGDTESHDVAEPGESSAAHPASSSSLLPSEPADERIDFNQHLPPIPGEASPVSSLDYVLPGSMKKGDALPGPDVPGSMSTPFTDHELTGALLPGLSTESDHETVDVPPSGPVSSTNPDSQRMGLDSSGKRKRPW